MEITEFTYSFVLFDGEFKIPREIDILNLFPKEISNQLIQRCQYIIKTYVTKKVFETFYNYLTKNESITIIDSDNFSQYYSLSQEFKNNSLLDTLIQPKYHEIAQISNLKAAISMNDNIDKSHFEEYISMNLDHFILNYSKEMYTIHITSLYNIFNHPKRKMEKQDLAYKFIIEGQTNEYNINGTSIFILIGSLESNKLSPKSLNDLIIHKENHFGFIPKINHKQKISLLHIKSKKVECFNLNFFNDLNEKNDNFEIKYITVFDCEIENTLKNQPHFLELFDIVLIGGCDSFWLHTEGITEKLTNDYLIKFTKQGGIVFFLHDTLQEKNEPLFKKLSDQLKYVSHNGKPLNKNDHYYSTIKFNESCDKKDLINFPFDLENEILAGTFKIRDTHIFPSFDQKYVVLHASNNVNNQYYVENLDANIGYCEICHRLDIEIQEKKLFYNIICHLYCNHT